MTHRQFLQESPDANHSDKSRVSLDDELTTRLNDCCPIRACDNGIYIILLHMFLFPNMFSCKLLKSKFIQFEMLVNISGFISVQFSIESNNVAL